MVKLTVKKIHQDRIKINYKIAQKLDINPGDVVTITEPSTRKNVVGLVSLENNFDENKIGINNDLIESLGVDEGFPVQINPYRKGLVPVKGVTLGISSSKDVTRSSEDVLMQIKRNEGDLLNFLGDKLFTINSKFTWDRFDVKINIEDTTPSLRADDVARFGELDNFKYRWVGKEVKTFDGILFIDVSGSMEKKKDMYCKGIDWAIDRMENEFTGLKAQKFFDQIKGKKKVSRLNGALLAALKYLVEKIGRGVGENIAVILFSDQGEVVEFKGGKKFYDSSQPAKQVANHLLDKAMDTWHGKTNLLDALKESKEITRDFDIDKMKMFVILTDGKVDNEKETYQYIKEHIFTRGDIVVNTLGLGKKTNENFLTQVANKSGGRYFNVNDLKELVEIYSEYAMNLEIQGLKENIDSWKGDRDLDEYEVQNEPNIPRCPECGSPLSYYSDNWYCHDCEKYIEGIDETDVPKCSSCENYLSYFEDDGWYCYFCEEYRDI